MTHHSVCPWWLGYVLASPVRVLWDNSRGLLPGFVREGMTVLEPGPGMGYFTLDLLRLTGPSGRVIAVDVQARMIAGLKRRAARAGLAGGLDARVVSAESMRIGDLAGKVDFVFAFAVVHEFPAAGRFFSEVAEAMRPGGRILLAEPAGHVKAQEFEAELRDAAAAGLRMTDRPAVRRSFGAVLAKAD